MDVLKRSVPQWLGGANNINQTQLTQFESIGRKMCSDYEVLIHNQQKLHTLLGKDKGT